MRKFVTKKKSTEEGLINNNTGLKNLELKINYKFSNPKLLVQSMTHRSYGTDFGAEEWIADNETLEFLGDAILNFVTASRLFKSIKNIDEGRLSQLRAAYVCQANLAKGARKLNLAQYLRVSKAMRAGGPIDLPSVLSDALEALIGAVYLDSNVETAAQLIDHVLGEPPKKIEVAPKDPKTILQEKIQQLCSLTPSYLVQKSSGPAHKPNFDVDAYVKQKKLGTGTGKSKKIAASNCAQSVLDSLSKLSDDKIKAFILDSEN